jgi:hypothetical protein
MYEYHIFRVLSYFREIVSHRLLIISIDRCVFYSQKEMTPRVPGGMAPAEKGDEALYCGRGQTWEGRVDLGGRPPRSPTDPDVRVKRIWLFIS